MTNAFPGIDPFIEDQNYWPDFHHTFINEWRAALRKALPPNYVARIDERVNLIEYVDYDSKQFGPDLSIMRRKKSRPRRAKTTSVALLEPVVIPMAFEAETRETFIKILHHPDMTLVAVLEVLSPANKAGPGRHVYRAKRHALASEPIHLVELDMLFRGRHPPLEAPYPPADFFALIARAELRPDCHVFGWTLRDSLPTIPIPLLPGDADVNIDLAPVYAATLEEGEYQRWIDYARPLRVKLSQSNAAWLKEKAKRMVR
jgi:hypothetical protein